MDETAHGLKRDLVTLTSGSGTSEPVTPGFAASVALDECEKSWDTTLRAEAAQLAARGDDLVLNAKTYFETEIANVGKFVAR